MKKLLIALLALCLVGGAFAQDVMVTLGAGGTVTLYDQDGNATFARSGAGTDVLTFKGADKDGKWGFAVNYDDFLAGPFPAYRDWNAWYKFDGGLKVSVGKLRNGDYRSLLQNGFAGNYVGATTRIMNKEYGILTQFTGIEGLNVGLALPIGETAALMTDVLQKSKIGVKYSNDMVTVKANAFLNLIDSDNTFDGSVNYTGVENLDVIAIVIANIATENTIDFGVGATYAMDKLDVALEFEGENAAELVWDVAAHVGYQIMDPLSASATFIYNSDATYDGSANIDYDFGNGLDLGLTVGYDSEVYYSLDLGYSIEL